MPNTVVHKAIYPLGATAPGYHNKTPGIPLPQPASAKQLEAKLEAKPMAKPDAKLDAHSLGSRISDPFPMRNKARRGWSPQVAKMWRHEARANIDQKQAGSPLRPSPEEPCRRRPPPAAPAERRGRPPAAEPPSSAHSSVLTLGLQAVPISPSSAAPRGDQCNWQPLLQLPHPAQGMVDRLAFARWADACLSVLEARPAAFVEVLEHLSRGSQMRRLPPGIKTKLAQLSLCHMPGAGRLSVDGVARSLAAVSPWLEPIGGASANSANEQRRLAEAWLKWSLRVLSPLADSSSDVAPVVALLHALHGSFAWLAPPAMAGLLAWSMHYMRSIPQAGPALASACDLDRFLASQAAQLAQGDDWSAWEDSLAGQPTPGEAADLASDGPDAEAPSHLLLEHLPALLAGYQGLGRHLKANDWDWLNQWCTNQLARYLPAPS